MRLSNLFGRTLREPPADAELTSHALLVRAGMIRPLASGLYIHLPLGWQVMHRLTAIVQHEMETVGGQEMRMPVLSPAELWQMSGRLRAAGPELVRLRDRAERDLVLSMTHEETVAIAARSVLQSYRDLPVCVYQFQSKIRDETRPRGGLVRLREFLMKDAYSFHTTADDLDSFFNHMRRAYENVFRRVDLMPIEIEASPGLMGGDASTEYMLPHHLGEDHFLECADCDYAANIEVAVADKGTSRLEDPLPLSSVATPNAETISDLATCLDIPPERIGKSVWFVTDDEPVSRLVVAIVRGDLDVDVRRLCEVVQTRTLRPATAAEMGQVGAVAGYASAIGIDRSPANPGEPQLVVVVDDTIPACSNLVVGANQPGTHYRNANYGRDFTADIVANIAAVREGDICPRCSGRLRLRRGIELGHLFRLGDRYAASMEVTFRDRNGRPHHPVMGSYGIGLDRLMAAIVEVHHDDRGIVWPPSVAPADLHLVAIKLDDARVREMAEGLYAELRISGRHVLYDDRPESPGVKFADADLIGIPLRLAVSPRTIARGVVEVKPRTTAAAEEVALDDLYAWLEAWNEAP